MNGSLYLGSKPVMWSPVEKTALAEAEVEYRDHQSPTIWVKYPLPRQAIFAQAVDPGQPTPRSDLMISELAELADGDLSRGMDDDAFGLFRSAEA